MNDAKQWILEHLDVRCAICGNTDFSVLDIYHSYGQEYLEKEYFQGKNMLEFYVEHWDRESKYLKVICNCCNLKESKGESMRTLGPELKELEKFLILTKEDDSNFSKQDLEEAQTMKKRRLEHFLSDNPQFVPIYERIHYLMTHAFEPLDGSNSFDYDSYVFKKRLKWLPERYGAILVVKAREFSDLSKKIKEEKIKTMLRYGKHED